MSTTTKTTCTHLGDCDCSRGHLHRNRWLTVLAAMAVATALGGVYDPVLGVDLVVGADGGERRVENLAITLTSLVVGLLGWGLLELLEKRSARPRRTWTLIATAVLLVSLLGPLGAATAGAALALLSLHLVVGGILIWGLRR
jgi:hypothetical protein